MISISLSSTCPVLKLNCLPSKAIGMLKCPETAWKYPGNIGTNRYVLACAVGTLAVLFDVNSKMHG
jgi:hypothetical protein